MNGSICGCLRCALGSSRNKFVFGVGSEEAKVVFIGEAPGAEEDRQGYPFVGRAGKLLDHMLTEIGWSRDEVYICNILKCRPPNNRDPLPEEIGQCEPYLHEQLRLLNAQWLVALGRVAAQTLLRVSDSLGSMRGRIHKYRDKPFWVIYHPAALLRNQNLMPHAHQDLLTLQKMVEEGQTQMPGELL
jgi:DNA polymerase